MFKKKTKENDLFNAIEEAKQIIGDEAAEEIADYLGVDNLDEAKMRASCPWHSDSNPSFIWDKKRKYWHCFSCQRTYSILDMYVEQEGSFIAGARKLLQRAGVDYNFKDKTYDDENYFENYVYPREETNTVRDKVEEYLGKRGISKETLDYAGIKQDARGNIVFESRDRNGRLLAVKYRKSGKVRKGEPKMWYQKDASNCPILWPVLKIDTTKPLVITEGECYTGDTEVLTPEGWVRLDQYNGQQVMQVHEDMSGSFVTPLAYVKHEYDGDMYYRDNRMSKLAVTANHNMVYVDCKGRLVKRKACEMPRTIGVGYIPTAINYDGPGIPLTDDQIALYIAVCADCTIDVKQSTGHRHSRFAVKKDRKYIRMKRILDRLGIKYFENTKARNGEYKYIGFVTPDWIKDKRIPQEWVYQATLRQKKFILDELVEWDGNHVVNRNQVEFNSAILKDCEVVQQLSVTCGYGSSIYRKEDKYGLRYRTNIRYGNDHTCFQKGWDKIEHYNGMVYCVTVPTGMILVRYKGRVSVCGNCDALSVMEAGEHNVVSIPHGSADTSWINFNFEFLEQFETIILWFDNDSAGQNGLHNIVKRLGEYRCKIVKPGVEVEDAVEAYYQQFGSKWHIRKTDANNVLLACGKEKILQLINTAEEIPIKNVSYLMDAKSISIADMEKFPMGIKGLDDLFYGNIFPCFSIYSGYAGSGKSSLTGISTVISALENGEKIFCYSGELSSGQLSDWILSPLAGYNHIMEFYSEKFDRPFYSITDQAEAEIRRFYRENILIYNSDDALETNAEDLISTMTMVYRKYGVRVFLIDNLMSLSLDGEDADSKWEAQKKFIIKLANFTNNYGVNVNLVAHPRKPGGGNSVNTGSASVYDISGASEISNLSHRMLWISRIKDDTMPPDIGKVKIEIVKDRPTQSAGMSCEAFYDKKTRRIYTNDEEKYRKYSWELNLEEEHKPIQYNAYVEQRLICNKKQEDTLCDQF